MQSESIRDILKYAPNTRCFAIGSDDLAQRNSERATRHLPRPQRRQAARRQYLKWKRSVDSIIADARNTNLDLIIRRLGELPLDAIRLTFDPVTADETIGVIANEIRQSLSIYRLIGIFEQHISDELVFIWLWKD